MLPLPEPTSTDPAEVLPLPLAPFEVYYDLDDCDEYPTTFPVELRFRGPLDRGLFEQALRAALDRQPLLRARIDDSPTGPRWVSSDSSALPLDWATDDVPMRAPEGDRLDLRICPGLRVWVRTCSTGARVLFQFHHAASDGLAALQFANELLARYRIAAGNTEDTRLVRPVDSQTLRARDALVTDEPRTASLGAGVRDAWYTLKVWSSILFRTPEVLAAPATRSADQSARELLAFEIAEFSPEETSALRKLASARGVTTNDLLLRDLLLVMRRWNDQQSKRRRGRLRINVPVNLRTRQDVALPAANRIGYGFVTARLGEGADPAAVLETVRQETKRIKDWKLGLYFLGGLAFARTIPGLLPWAMHRERSFATAVLSNVGRFVTDRELPPHEKWHCGDLTLEWIGGVPPLRRLTRAAIIAIEYAGRLSLCLRTDPNYFDDAATRSLLASLAEEVRESIRQGK